ncbi:MAG: DNA-binding response regulator [Acidobacteria bacterium]|nr:MAG: DNA-binding response regulator [Acidobacteriota bacterium]
MLVPFAQWRSSKVDRIRVLLADDTGLVRTGLRAVLEEIPQVEVVGEAADVPEIMCILKQHQPQIVLIHRLISMMNCLELASRIAEESLKARVIVLSRNANGEHIGQALRSGAAGYLVMNTSSQELEKAIRTVASGETYISNLALTYLADFVRAENSQESLLDRLTRRQREVLKLVVRGRSTKQIALALNISVKTVECHRTQIMERLDIHDIASLVRYAIKIGLLEIEDRTNPTSN